MSLDIINIYKEQGTTSFDIVFKVRKILNVKCGHIGTLDKLAAGVLPIFLGKTTKLTNFFLEHDKKYRVEFVLGYSSSSYDLETPILEKDDRFLEKENVFFDSENSLLEIEKKLKLFEKTYMQIPPIYSAKKYNGKKLYEYARNIDFNDTENDNTKKILSLVNNRAKEVTIYNISNVAISDKLKDIEVVIEQDCDIKKCDTISTRTISFDVFCSSGTYIRSLIRDIAKELGTIGIMVKLERLMVSDIFTIENSIKISDLNSNLIDSIDSTNYKESINNINNVNNVNNVNNINSKYMFDSKDLIEKIYSKKWDSYILSKIDEKRFLNGVKLNISKLNKKNITDKKNKTNKTKTNEGVLQEYCLIYINNGFDLLGIGKIKDGTVKREYIC